MIRYTVEGVYADTKQAFVTDCESDSPETAATETLAMDETEQLVVLCVFVGVHKDVLAGSETWGKVAY